MASENLNLSHELIVQIHQCDTLFADIDTVKDRRLSFEEFEAYVTKRNSSDDKETVMKEFRAIN